MDLPRHPPLPYRGNAGWPSHSSKRISPSCAPSPNEGPLAQVRAEVARVRIRRNVTWIATTEEKAVISKGAPSFVFGYRIAPPLPDRNISAIRWWPFFSAQASGTAHGAPAATGSAPRWSRSSTTST
jgi:hypothetical protein